MKKLLLIVPLALTLFACQPKEQAETKVYGRYVPERKDDFAWENEYAENRKYGPAQLPGKPYHINYGMGLVCYKVAHTVGCGGLAVVAEDVLYVGGPYSRWEVLEQTPERFSFRLDYDSLLVCGQVMQASVTITAEAGKLLNRADIVINNRSKILLPQLYVGGGIYLHDTIDNIMKCPCGAIAYAEDALSDKGAAQMNFDYNGSTSQGRNYVGVITPGATRQEIIDGSLLSLREYTLGDTLTYYFGGCWSEWSNGEETMASDEDWFNAIRAFAKTL